MTPDGIKILIAMAVAVIGALTFAGVIGYLLTSRLPTGDRKRP
jgi:hypothetical protein